MYGRWTPIDRGGIARNPGESIKPRLWQGCIGLWAPCLGPSGNNLREWTAGGARANGTLTNMDGNDWVQSPLGWALDFDGSNDYVSLPAAAIARLSPTTGITIFAVIRTASSVSIREYITNAGGAGPSGFGFGISDAVALQTKWYTGGGGSGHNLQGGTTMTAGQWYSVAATYFPAASGTNKFTYLDGKVDQSGSTTNTMAFSGTSAGIATYAAASSQYWPGSMPIIGVWNYAMQPTQIAALHSDPVQMFRRRRVMMTVKAGAAAVGTTLPWLPQYDYGPELMALPQVFAN